MKIDKEKTYVEGFYLLEAVKTFTFGKRFAGVVLAVVLVSSFASIPFRMNSFDESDSRSAFEKFIDGITGKSLPEAHADKPPNKKFKVDETGSPFQRGLKKGIQDKQGQGKPHPEATFEDPIITKDNKTITIKGKTKLKFDNPGKAGKDKWDDYVVEKDPALAGNGTIQEGNYTELVIKEINKKVMQKAKELENSTGMNSTIHHAFKSDDDGDGMTDEDPVDGVDNDEDGQVDEDPIGKFEFGFEERQIEIEETYKLTFEDEEDAVEAFALIISDEDPMTVASEFVSAAGTNTVTQNVLMGFTIAPPKIDWTIGTKQEVCIDLLFDEFCFTAFEARAGFFLEYGLGLRLPVQVAVTTVDTMVEEHLYATSTTRLEPLDFSAAQYSAMGVAPFNGNEFAAFLKFFLGVKVVVVEVTVIDWALDTDIDLAEMCTEFTHESSTLEDVDCGNFVTPFGIDPDTGLQREFPVPAVTLPADKTGLKMSFAGASLGIGLKIDPTFGSGLITADWSAAGDATGGGAVQYVNSGTDVPFGPIAAGNISPGTDNAEIRLDNYRYHLNVMQIALSANIDLGGWLSFVPDLPYFEIVTFDLNDLGLPDLSLGQHDGTPGVQKDVFVQHFGVDVEVAPGTLDIEPGSVGDYAVMVTNTGNTPDTFDTFAVSGLLPNWESSLEEGAVSLNPGQSTSFTVGIKPYRHFATSPGDYPFSMSGASEGAKVYGLVRMDSDGAVVHALPFFEPHLGVTPLFQERLPGETTSYLIVVENFGNAPDNVTLGVDLLDFGDAYRAVPTALQPAWTAIGTTSFGPLDPGQGENTTFTVTVPATWEGMENSTYSFTGTATSEADPTAAVSTTADLGVVATKESMARYVDLEILSLVADVNASGVEPDLKQSLLDQLNSAEQKKLQGLDNIMDGRFKQANNMLDATANIMSAFVSHVEAQKSKGIPESLADDWVARGNQVVADLATTIAQTF